MKIRNKKTGEVGSAREFNTSSLSEILVFFENGGADSDYIQNYDVFLESKQEWKDMSEAFKDKDLIIDNHNTYFAEPQNEEDRKRGYFL